MIFFKIKVGTTKIILSKTTLFFSSNKKDSNIFCNYATLVPQKNCPYTPVDIQTPEHLLEGLSLVHSRNSNINVFLFSNQHASCDYT